ncbi:MAG: ribosome biogenesis factor YjgA [Pseudomonadota bacterium]
MSEPESDHAEKPSKTRRKRDMEALQALGRELLTFSDETLQQLALPEGLLDAVLAARKIMAHGAQRRQLQYIGKLMRGVDPEPIKAAIAAREHQQDTHNQAFHLLEDLREALIFEADSALAVVLEHFPQADRQHLRKLARQARKEHNEKQPPRASRRLFRYLRELQEADAS